MIIISNLLGINELNKDANRFILKTNFVFYIFTFLINFAHIFFLLHALSLVSLEQLTILVAVTMLTESIIALPIGTIGDIKGQKLILIISTLFYALTYNLIIKASSFTDLLLVFIILGIASSLNMENYFSFFDTNYQHYAYEDVDKRVYIKYSSRFFMISLIIIGISYITGAYLVSTSNRINLFNIVVYGLLITAILKLLLLKDHREVQRNKHLSNAFSEIKNTITYSLSHIRVLIFIAGSIILSISLLIWENFFAVIFYQDLGKTDDWIGILVSGEVFLTAIVLGLLGGLVSNLKRIKQSYQLFTLLAPLFFFGGLILFVQLIDLTNSFNINNVIIFFGLLFLIIIPFQISDLLSYAIVLSFIKEEFRGGVYAIIPAIRGLFGGIILLFGSQLVATRNYEMIFSYLALIGFIGGLLIAISLVWYKITPSKVNPLAFFTCYLYRREMSIDNFVLISTQRSIQKNEDKIRRILERITKVALQDSFITEEEKELIDLITSDLQGYVSLASESKNLIFKADSTVNEIIIELQEYKKKIWDNAYRFSINKGEISNDLMNILMELSTVIKEDLN